jgi:asparagine synthase (glutamine-hydrolysing)
MPSPAAILRFDGAPPTFTTSRSSRVASGVRWTLLIDGRLDNRADLARRLEMPRDADDAAVVLCAMERWGAAAAAQLLGDFAYVAWDARERQALLARDHLGIRSLYFTRHSGGIEVDWEIAPLLASRAAPAAIEEETAAQFHAGELENGCRTLYRGIGRVPPAHVVTMTVDGLAAADAYWTAEPREVLRYRTDAEYAEHCRELLATSVACRVAPGATAVALSGGLDSSALAAVAHLMVGADVRPFSLIFPEHPETNEEPYIDAVSRRIGVPAVKVRPGAASLATFVDWTYRWRDLAPLPADAASMSLWAEMARQGMRIAFTGAGGDYLFCGTPFHYADLLRQGDVLGLARDWRANVRAGSSPSLRRLLATGVWPALPLRTRRTLRPLARRLAPHPAAEHSRWLKLHPTSAPTRPPRTGSVAIEAIARDLTSGMHTYFLQSASRAAATAGIELRYPLLDVRLVEYLLAVPEDQRRRNGVQKWLLRQALATELPDAVRTRTTKADFSHVALQVFESAADVFRDLRLEELGWVDGDAVRAMLARMRHLRAHGDESFGDAVPALWAVLALELWVRAL